MSVKVSGGFHAQFQGYKQPYTFEKDGQTINVGGKLQFLVTDADSGEVEVWGVNQKTWQLGGGEPHVDIAVGEWFLIEGSIDITAQKPWFRVEKIGKVER